MRLIYVFTYRERNIENVVGERRYREDCKRQTQMMNIKGVAGVLKLSKVTLQIKAEGHLTPFIPFKILDVQYNVYAWQIGWVICRSC